MLDTSFPSSDSTPSPMNSSPSDLDQFLAYSTRDLVREQSPHYQELLAHSTLPTQSPTGAEPTQSAGASSQLAPHWRAFFDHLDTRDVQSLNQKQKELERQIKDNGVTYNVYTDQHGPQRPWSLDLFPFLINEESWQTLESAVTQQVKLLQLVMEDIYGEQRLTKSGLLPPALVNGHPGFLRSMQGVKPLGGQHLHIVAFDVARSPSGQWRLLSQRAQAPSGLGYLLENRSIISRLFPRAMSALGVQGLHQTYRSMMDHLKEASGHGPQSHIALLTPGPYNETYFEHAYLARFLGATLVQGRDLTVRNQHLYLNTLRGLEPVHGLIKRLDDEFLDPLELREDSTLGVPGLMQVIRAGNVLVANAPGAGVLESPALLGFLPAICQSLLGEPLKLSSLSTWWCGEKAAFESVTTQLNDCVIKPTYPYQAQRPTRPYTVLGRHLSETDLEHLRQDIRAQPDQYTAQKYLPLSQLPTWDQHQISSRSCILRVFAIRQPNDQWSILPGGLARLATQGAQVASMQRGGSSADVWVQGKNQSSPASSAPMNTELDLSVKKRIVTSRAAENLYWLGRYSERSENILRQVRLTLEGLNAEQQFSGLWRHWISRLAYQQGLIDIDMSASPELLGEPRRFERRLIACLEALSSVTSLGFNLRALQLAASAVRERLSLDHWLLIERTQEEFSASARRWSESDHYPLTEVIRVLGNTHNHLAAITGAQTDRMVRDDGWRLLSIGRHVERLSYLSQVLDGALSVGGLAHLENDDTCFLTLLNLFDSTITFQAQHQQSRSLKALFDLIVLDGDNPRSLAWVAQTLRGRLAKLAGCGPLEIDALASMVPKPETWVNTSNPAEHSGQDLNALANNLRAGMGEIFKVSHAIGEKYFTHTLNATQTQTQYQAVRSQAHPMAPVERSSLALGSQR